MKDISLVIEERIGRTFNIGSQKKASHRAAKFWIPCGGNQMMKIYLYVLVINVPFLPGTIRIDEQKLYVNKIKDILESVKPK